MHINIATELGDGATFHRFPFDFAGCALKGAPLGCFFQNGAGECLPVRANRPQRCYMRVYEEVV